MSKNQQPRRIAGRSSKIRLAETADVPALVALNGPVQELHASLYPFDFNELVGRDEAANFFLRLIGAEKHSIALFEGVEGPLGYIWFEEQERRRSAFMKPSRIIHIHHLSVTRAARDKGIGTALMNFVSAEAYASGVSTLVVEHWAENEIAHRFFSREGFANLRIMMQRELARKESLDPP